MTTETFHANFTALRRVERWKSCRLPDNQALPLESSPQQALSPRARYSRCPFRCRISRRHWTPAVLTSFNPSWSSDLQVLVWVWGLHRVGRQQPALQAPGALSIFSSWPTRHPNHPRSTLPAFSFGRWLPSACRAFKLHDLIEGCGTGNVDTRSTKPGLSAPDLCPRMGPGAGAESNHVPIHCVDTPA